MTYLRVYINRIDKCKQNKNKNSALSSYSKAIVGFFTAAKRSTRECEMCLISIAYFSVILLLEFVCMFFQEATL